MSKKTCVAEKNRIVLKNGTTTVFLTGYNDVKLQYEALGIQYYGVTSIKPVGDWHHALEQNYRYSTLLDEARARIAKLERYIADKAIQDMKND